MEKETLSLVDKILENWGPLGFGWVLSIACMVGLWRLVRYMLDDYRAERIQVIETRQRLTASMVGLQRYIQSLEKRIQAMERRLESVDRQISEGRRWRTGSDGGG